MARDLSKYTAEQQEAIRQQRRERAAARRQARKSGQPHTQATRRTGKTARKAQPGQRTSLDTFPGEMRTVVRDYEALAAVGGGDGFDTSHEDAVLAQFGY